VVKRADQGSLADTSNCRTSLQQITKIVAENLIALAGNAEKYSDLLNDTVVFPLPNYPGRVQGEFLGQIVRKKLEPEAESWVEQGRVIDATLGANKEELERFWEWAGDWLDKRVNKFLMEEYYDQYTPEEKELGEDNVRTGLRPIAEDASDDEEEDKSEDDEDDGKKEAVIKKEDSSKKQAQVPGRSLNDILRFSSGIGFGVDTANGMR